MAQKLSLKEAANLNASQTGLRIKDPNRIFQIIENDTTHITTENKPEL